MDFTHRDLLVAGCGAASAGALAATAYSGGAAQSPGSSNAVVIPTAFGAVPNDVRMADRNVRAFNAAAAHAIESQAVLMVPAGTWFLTAEGRPGDGWNVTPGRNRRCRIIGEGITSIVKRAPANRAGKFAAMVRLWVTDGGESFDIQGLCFDGNEAEFPYDPNDRWAFQQAHSVELASRSRTIAARSVLLRDIYLTGAVADGFKIGAQCEELRAQRVRAWGRTRRTRSDIQFSRLPKLAVLEDILVDAFETEPWHMVSGAMMYLKDVAARTKWDLLGPKGEVEGRLKVIGVNCRLGVAGSRDAAVTLIFHKVDGQFTGGAFATGAPQDPKLSNRLRSSTLRFVGTQFHIGGGSFSSASPYPLIAHFAGHQDRLEFVDCSFTAEPTPAAGSYIDVAATAGFANRLSLENCRTDGALDYVVTAASPISIRASGGALRARKAIAKLGGALSTRPRIETQDRSKWTAPDLIVEE